MFAQYRILLFAFIGLYGCATVPTPAPLPARKRLIPYEKLRIGVLEFSSPYGDKDYGKTYPAFLVKELRKTNRFLIKEVAGFGGKVEGSGDKYLDMYISGNIRSISREACAEVHLVNAQNHEVIAAFSPCGLTELDNTVAAIAKLFLKEKDGDAGAGDAANKRGGITLGSIASVDGDVVVINIGSKNLIKRGMVASIHAKGEFVDAQNVALRKALLAYAGEAKDLARHFYNDVVGSLYVISVEPDYSIGVFYGGDYVVPGDEVEFK